MTATRDRFVLTASLLFQQKGYGATSVGEIADVGELPIGSLYYHFPGGKEELGAAAVLHGADGFAAVLREGLSQSDDPGVALGSCARLLADRLEASEWRDGCPVATVALETVHSSAVLQAAAAEALQSWIEVVAGRLVSLGVGSVEAEGLASTTISLLEGAELMCRVSKSRIALDVGAGHLERLVSA